VYRGGNRSDARQSDILKHHGAPVFQAPQSPLYDDGVRGGPE
jgi:hypothetical protein